VRQPVWGVQLKGIRRQRRGERVVKYHRASGIRLPDLPETHPEFMAAWQAAEASLSDPLSRAKRAPVTPGSLAEMIRAVKAGRHFRELSLLYRTIMTREFDTIEAAYGTAPVKGMKPKHIKTDLDKLNAVAANRRLKAWRLIMGHAHDAEHIESDPSRDVRKRKVVTDGYIPWTSGDIAKFRAHWPIGTMQRACFELVCWTGARTNDAVTLGPRNIDHDGVLIFKQSKVGKPAHVPWNSPMPPYATGWVKEREDVKAALACLAGGFTFLEARGRVRSVKGLGNLISQSARKAGIEKSAHGLRKARLTAIAEAGGSAHAIMAWGGHQSLQEAERYTREANRKRLVMGTEQPVNVVSPADLDTKTAKN
jgi:integrase/recombinase XerD